MVTLLLIVMILLSASCVRAEHARLAITSDGMCTGNGNITHLYHTTCTLVHASKDAKHAEKIAAAYPADWLREATARQHRATTLEKAKNKHGCTVPDTALWRSLATARLNDTNPIRFYHRLHAKRRQHGSHHYTGIVADMFLATDASGIQYMNFCRIRAVVHHHGKRWNCSCSA